MIHAGKIYTRLAQGLFADCINRVFALPRSKVMTLVVKGNAKTIWIVMITTKQQKR